MPPLTYANYLDWRAPDSPEPRSTPAEHDEMLFIIITKPMSSGSSSCCMSLKKLRRIFPLAISSARFILSSALEPS